MNAKEVLIAAIGCDQDGRLLEALHRYQEGIEMLMAKVDHEADTNKKNVYKAHIKDYIDRAEQIKDTLRKNRAEGSQIANKEIEEDSMGHSYKSLFGKYLDKDVREILIEESYLVEPHQRYNLVVFFELVIKNCPNLKFVHLITKAESNNAGAQEEYFKQFQTGLAEHGITMTLKFEPTLHDRKIILSNGYIIRIGRGLDYFKRLPSQYALGRGDYDFRKCRQTECIILRTKPFGK